LIVDDDPAIRASLAEAIEDTAIELVAADSGEAALGLLDAAKPDVVLTDVRMPGLDGLTLLATLRERRPDIDVVMMTAYDDMPTVVAAMREGAADFLVKPLRLHDLRRVLARIFEDRATRARTHPAERSAAAYRLDRLVGRDPRMIEIYKLVGQLAANRATVLIRGESGTGKELIARAIHYNSPDAGQPFVPVNCTALPETLLESELFGHVRGSFTGAVASRRGRFDLAGRGTIFLDEIGDTTPEFQTKLLRVLESREYYPVGAEQAEHTKARVLAATHRNLESLVEAGQFRSDLYFRLRVVEIVLPPLRERRADLPELAAHLVRRTSEALGRADAPVLSKEALDEILKRDWPGNVRELENCLTRAVILATGKVIRPEHVGPAGEAVSDVPTLAEVERDHVRRVLAMSRGNKVRAARVLGISRPRLDRLIRVHHLDP
jgi:DNA-binding NtrC family response regulator